MAEAGPFGREMRGRRQSGGRAFSERILTRELELRICHLARAEPNLGTAMNLKTLLLMLAGAVAICIPLYAQTDAGAKSSQPQKNSVTTLNGTKFFGIVEVTDDYTIRISNDSGVTRLPIAQLGDADFKKYGLNKDRSKDGRLWYERKEALEDSRADNRSAKDSKSNGNSLAEIRLGEIAAFQPLIAAYEKTLGSKKSEKSAESSLNPHETTSGSDTSFTPMFSQPGMAGSLAEPFTGLGSSALQPISGAASGATGVIQSATGAASLPTAPP
jgi:hypothetical protein